MKKRLLPALLILISCNSATKPTNEPPQWLNKIEVAFASEPVTNPPREIWEYSYDSALVYYTPPVCCDQFGILYNNSGDTMCFPDGGIHGTGDGRCPDFILNRTGGKLLWRDNRSAN
jgi:hypothetical protein